MRTIQVMSEQSVKPPNLPRLVSRFLGQLEVEGRSARTVRAYEGDLRYLIEYANAIGRPPDEEVVASYGQWLTSERPAAGATQHRRLVAARQFLGFLADGGHIDCDLRSAVDLPETRTDRSPPPCAEDVHLLLEAPDVGTPIGLRDAVMFRLMADHGLTADDVCSLRWSHFDLDRHTLSVPDRECDIYNQYLAADLLQLRERAHAQDENAPMFVSQRGGCLTPSGVAQRVGRYCADLRDRLSEPLTPRRLREYAIAEQGRNTTFEEVERFADALGFRTMEGARRRLQQAIEEHDASLLRDLLPVEEAARASDSDVEALRQWAAEGMSHRTDEQGEILVSLVAVREWGARPVPGGRDVDPSRPVHEADASGEKPSDLPAGLEAFVGLFEATGPEESASAWEAFEELGNAGIAWGKDHVRTRLAAIGRQFEDLLAAVGGLTDQPRDHMVLQSQLKPLLQGFPEADAVLDPQHPGFDEAFLAVRSRLIEANPLLRGYDAAVRMAWEHEQVPLQAAQEMPLNMAEPTDDTAQARAAEDGGDGFFRRAALSLVDTPQSFRLWDELPVGSPALTGLLLLMAPLTDDLWRHLEAAVRYYDLPDDQGVQQAAFGGLLHGFLSAVICACPAAVERAREQTGGPSGGHLLVLEHVKVGLLALWCAAGLLPTSSDGALRCAPRLAKLEDPADFCSQFEARWEELQEYSLDPWRYSVMPKVGVSDLVRYALLTYGPDKCGNPHVARQVCDHVIYLSKASAQSLVLSVWEPTPAQVSNVLYNLLLPLTDGLYREMLERVAAKCGISEDELDEEVSGELPTDLRHKAYQLWRAFDFSRGSHIAEEETGRYRGHTSFIAYFRRGASRQLRMEENRLLHELLFASESLEALAEESAEEDTSPHRKPRGLEYEQAVPLGRGGEVLCTQSIEGPDGTLYLTSRWLAIRVGCTERQLRALDDALQPLRVQDVFGDQPPEQEYLPPDARLYPLAAIDRGRIERLLRSRKHRCQHLPEDYLTRGAIADVLDCTPQALAYWERKGELSPQRIGGVVAYDHTEAIKAARLIKGGRPETPHEPPEEDYEALMTQSPGGPGTRSGS